MISAFFLPKIEKERIFTSNFNSLDPNHLQKIHLNSISYSQLTFFFQKTFFLSNKNITLNFADSSLITLNEWAIFPSFFTFLLFTSHPLKKSRPVPCINNQKEKKKIFINEEVFFYFSFFNIQNYRLCIKLFHFQKEKESV